MVPATYKKYPQTSIIHQNSKIRSAILWQAPWIAKMRPAVWSWPITPSTYRLCLEGQLCMLTVVTMRYLSGACYLDLHSAQSTRQLFLLLPMTMSDKEIYLTWFITHHVSTGMNGKFHTQSLPCVIFKHIKCSGLHRKSL